MVSGRLFEYLEGRLRLIIGVSHLSDSGIFGNGSILAVGDFYQLAPVMAESLVLPSTWFGNQLFRENFQFVELTQVMRRKDDAMFANMLNSLRISDKNEPLSDEIDCMLRSRENLPDEPDMALLVFGTKA